MGIDNKISSILLSQENRNTGKLRSSFIRISNQSCEIINNARNEINNALEKKELEESNEIHRLRHEFEDIKNPVFSGNRFEIVDGLIVLAEEKRRIRNLQCSFGTMRSNLRRTGNTIDQATNWAF